MAETARERYARLARELGGYFHPWRRVLAGPDPELTFDLLPKHSVIKSTEFDDLCARAKVQ